MDRWLDGTGSTRLVVVVWRLVSVSCLIALLAPIMRVGRRPYRLGRLADRLEAVRDMAVIPDGLPTQLRWFQAAVITTIVAGIALPFRARPLHLVASVPALVLAVMVHRSATRSDWTEPTTQLRLAIIMLVVTVVASLPYRARRSS